MRLSKSSDLLLYKAAGLDDTQPMTKHEQDWTAVSNLVRAPLKGLQESLKFPAEEVFRSAD